jgi:hypothetical protein
MLLIVGLILQLIKYIKIPRVIQSRMEIGSPVGSILTEQPGEEFVKGMEGRYPAGIHEDAFAFHRLHTGLAGCSGGLTGLGALLQPDLFHPGGCPITSGR